jgi:signal transduction histidine kinase
MDANTGSRSLAFFTDIPAGSTHHIDIDLGKPIHINGACLHATDISDNVPHAHPNTFGIPRHFQIIGAQKRDFTDGQLLADFQLKTAFDAGPILQLKFPTTHCQFLRLMVIEPDQIPDALSGCIGLAEIEYLNDGNNVAVASTVTTSLNPALISRQDRLLAITDGNNYYGEILPTRTWLNQLARRHELETEHPLAQAALTTAYQSQKAAIELLFWLSCLLTAIIAAIIVIQRLLKHRAIYNTREQIAADLHDELGANLHAISLCSDLASTKIHEPDQLLTLFHRIHELTSRSGKAAKACVNLLESKGLYEGLAADVERIAGRLLSDIEYIIHVEGSDHLESLDPKTQIGIALFFKECLANVIRHSGATHVTADLDATPTELVLTVTDNGKGLPSKESGVARTSPESLKRRARLLRGTVVTTDRPEGGTRITLRTKTKSWWL